MLPRAPAIFGQSAAWGRAGRPHRACFRLRFPSRRTCKTSSSGWSGRGATRGRPRRSARTASASPRDTCTSTRSPATGGSCSVRSQRCRTLSRAPRASRPWAHARRLLPPAGPAAAAGKIESRGLCRKSRRFLRHRPLYNPLRYNSARGPQRESERQRWRSPVLRMQRWQSRQRRMAGLRVQHLMFQKRQATSQQRCLAVLLASAHLRGSTRTRWTHTGTPSSTRGARSSKSTLHSRLESGYLASSHSATATSRRCASRARMSAVRPYSR